MFTRDQRMRRGQYDPEREASAEGGMSILGMSQ